MADTGETDVQATEVKAGTPARSTAKSPTEEPTLDLSLASAISALTHHLTAPLASSYPHATILALRSALVSTLTALFTPTWRTEDPSFGSGARSLICLRTKGLPAPMRTAAKTAKIEERVWRKMLHGKGTGDEVDKERKKRMDEWQVWCDPGSVCVRYGAWEWFDAEFDPVRSYREPIITIWKAAQPPADTSEPFTALLTPARPSAAIQIRAPSGQPITPGPGMPPVSAIDSARTPPTAPAALLRSTPITLSPSAHIRAVTSAALRSPVMLEGLGNPFGRLHSRASTYPTRSLTAKASGQGSTSGQSRHRVTSDVSTAESEISNEGSSSEVEQETEHDNENETDDHSDTSMISTASTNLLTPAGTPGHTHATVDIFTSAEEHGNHRVTPTGPSKMTNRAEVIIDTPLARGRDPSPNAINASVPTAKATGNGDKDKPASTDKPPTPSVTPYDGGNVTVLGGGVKLGGSSASVAGSRAGSVMSQHRVPYDRARSPSISLASRALNNVTGPGEGGSANGGGHGGGGGGRKPRTRRRIMPTYLGYVGQPGVGGPVPYAFQNMSVPVTPSSLGPNAQGQTQGQGQQHGKGENSQPQQQPQWAGVGVGIGMPPVRQPLQRIA